MRGVSSQRFVENRVSLLCVTFAAILPNQGCRSGEQRGLEPRIGRLTCLFDEAMRDLAPPLGRLLDLLYRLHDLGIVGFTASEQLVCLAGTLIVH